jgi:hypothetical protein
MSTDHRVYPPASGAADASPVTISVFEQSSRYTLDIVMHLHGDRDLYILDQQVSPADLLRIAKRFIEIADIASGRDVGHLFNALRMVEAGIAALDAP